MMRINILAVLQMAMTLVAVLVVIHTHTSAAHIAGLSKVHVTAYSEADSEHVFD